ncbi:MAG: hypothetical protein ACQES8_02425 [Thermodesulfobacteriota bacterium]
MSPTKNSKIICFSRRPELGKDPGFWLARVKAAGKKPLEVLKDDSTKATLKTRLDPWGKVCLQKMKKVLQRIGYSIVKTIA